MADQLPALLVVVPLLAAPLCVALRRGRAAYPLALVVSWISFLTALALLRQTIDQGTIVYALGNWAAPWGIEYRIDVLGAALATLVSLVAAIVLTYAPRSLQDEIPEDRGHLFLAAFLLCMLGMLGIAITGDLFNVFVFLEINALSTYVLIALGRDRRALRAAFQYLVMGTVGATFILIGIGLMYVKTGTLNMADMANRIDSVEGTRTILAAFGFLSVGLFLKMAVFPLHAWLPNAYTYAPSVVTAFVAATATKIAVYILLRFFYTVFGAQFAEMSSEYVVLPWALLGIFVASTVAVFQRNVKRILAYSSVAQIGYIVLGIGLGTATGLTGSIVHIFNHALIKGGLFLAMGSFALRAGSVRLDDLRGIGRQMPWTMAAWVVGGLGLIGVPLTAGFISKWYLVQGALEAQLWPVAALMLVSSLIALVYVWRVVEVAYFDEPPTDRKPVREAPPAMLAMTWALIGASLWFGVRTEWTAGIARRAADLLLGGAGQ